MQGNHFIIADQNGQLVMSGQVSRQLNEDTYLCRMRGEVPVSRVVAVDQMSNWLIFDSEEHMQDWLAANAPKPPELTPEQRAQIEGLQKQRPVSEDIDFNEDNGSPQEVAAEDLPAGVFDPTSPLTPAEQLADYEAEQSRSVA